MATGAGSEHASERTAACTLRRTHVQPCLLRLQLQWKSHVVKNRKFSWEIEPSYNMQTRTGGCARQRTSGFRVCPPTGAATMTRALPWQAAHGAHPTCMQPLRDALLHATHVCAHPGAAHAQLAIWAIAWGTGCADVGRERVACGLPCQRSGQHACQESGLYCTAGAHGAHTRGPVRGAQQCVRVQRAVQPSWRRPWKLGRPS